MWLPGAFAIHLLVLQDRLLRGMLCSNVLLEASCRGATAFTWLSLCQTTRGSLCPAATSAVSGRCRGRRPPQIPPTIRAALRPASRTRLPSTRSSRHCPCRAGAAGIPESARAAPRSAPPCAGKTHSLRPTTCSPCSVQFCQIPRSAHAVRSAVLLATPPLSTRHRTGVSVAHGAPCAGSHHSSPRCSRSTMCSIAED